MFKFTVLAFVATLSVNASAQSWCQSKADEGTYRKCQDSGVELQRDRKVTLMHISVMPPAQQTRLLELIGNDAPAMRSAMCQQIDDVVIMSSLKLRTYCGK